MHIAVPKAVLKRRRHRGQEHQSRRQNGDSAHAIEELEYRAAHPRRPMLARYEVQRVSSTKREREPDVNPPGVFAHTSNRPPAQRKIADPATPLPRYLRHGTVMPFAKMTLEAQCRP